MKKRKVEKFNKGEVIIYKTPKGPELEVKLKGETVWLDAHQMARLFGVNRPAVVKHINNIYRSNELTESSTCSILEQVAADGKIRRMNLYNLDMVISVGYRVNSKRATQFRIWATKTLKSYLLKGYAVNEKRLAQKIENLNDLRKTIAFLQEKSRHELLGGKALEILDLLSDYAKSLSLLEQYDKNKLKLVQGENAKFILEYENSSELIKKIKQELIARKEAGDLFGQEISHKLESVIKNLNQTFGGKALYPSIEEKAANLLYLIIKDHPFADGNKRIASFLFVYFLDRSRYLYKKNGAKKISDNTLVSLALLIAVSKPKEKDLMVRLTTNLL